MKKFLLLVILFLGSITSVSAHVIVTPSEVYTYATQLFTVHVPAEENVPATALKLLIPDGLTKVSPQEKVGWTVTTKEIANKATEIDWVGGTIPVNGEANFLFTAQAPSQQTTLNWKAYLTYQDGTIDAFDKSPSQISGDEDPYSQTVVVSQYSKYINVYLDIGTGIIIVLLLVYFIFKRVKVKVEQVN